MPNPKEPGLSDNSIGALAYFTPIPAIFFLAIRRYNKRPYVRFHSWQSLIFSALVFLYSCTVDFVLPYRAPRSSSLDGTGVAGHPGLDSHFPCLALVRHQRAQWQALQTPNHWQVGRRASLSVTRLPTPIR